jgi:hypothetical protein
LRLDDDIPASGLIKLGAPPWQIAHGLLSLAEELAKLGRITIEEAVGDKGPLHSWIHLYDLGLAKPKMWRGIILHETVKLEKRLTVNASRR